MRRSVFAVAAAMVLMATPHFANAQQLKVAPKSAKGLFCTLCKAQGCSCNSAGDQCVSCGGSLKAASTSQTRSACADARGRLTKGRCRFN